jgi:MFS superfamily sulfate permease-like transporter
MPPTFRQDLLASFVVFLVALPLCMGIAIASGVSPAAGLITGIVGGIVTGMLSGCPLQVSGPAAGLAVLVFELVQKHGLETLAVIVLVAGCLQLLAGVARIGQLFRAISPSVVYGMLAGIGILIFVAQFHVMVDDEPRESGLRNLISIPESIYKGLLPVDGSSHHLAAYLGVGTIVLIVLWTRFAPGRLRWIPAALVAVCAVTAAATLLQLPVRYVNLPENIFGTIQWIPVASLSEIFRAEIAFAALALAFVASAETLLSATAVDGMHNGPKTRYDRELMSQGVGNVICGFAGALPMTGVIVRSATNVAAGAQTRMSAILHGVWMLLLIVVLPSILRLIPTASLAAILVYTGYKLVNVQNMRRLLAYGGAPFLIYAATVVTIVGVDLLTGIVLGLVLSMAKLMYARSHLTLEVKDDPAARRVDIRLAGAASFLRLATLSDMLEKVPADKDVFVSMSDLDYIDHAALEAVSGWEQQRKKNGQRVEVEWAAAYRVYRDSNPLSGSAAGPLQGSLPGH